MIFFLQKSDFRYPQTPFKKDYKKMCIYNKKNLAILSSCQISVLNKKNVDPIR